MSQFIERVKRFIPRVLNVVTTHARDLIERARKTAVQTFAATFMIPATTDIANAAVWKSAIYAAGAATISAAWNTIKNYHYERVAEKIQAAWVAENPQP